MLAFDRPWLLALLALPPGLWLLDRALGSGRLSLKSLLAFPHELPGGDRELGAPWAWRFLHSLRGAALGLGLAASVIAAAGPAIVNRRVLYLSRGNEVVFVLDVSPSMAASDFAPSRLEAAKSIIGDFLATRRNETVGLVAFGGEAALVCPPTLDYEVLERRMGSLVPGLYGEGTAIGAGLATAVVHAARSGAPEKHVVLLTDGENNAGAMDPGTAALIASRRGIELSVIGVGSPGEAPVSYVDPETGQKRTGLYRSGFDALALELLARAGGGRYYAAENRAALAQAFASLSERSASLSRTRSVSSEESLAQAFLLVSLGFLALAWLFDAPFSGRPSRRPRRQGGRS